MSTLAPAPLPHHRLHLPSHRHLSQLGFVFGVAAGALSYLVRERVSIAFAVFVLVWYVLAYGISKVVEHPTRRRQWAIHVALVPAAAVCGTVAIALSWPGHLTPAVLLALVASVALQAAVTQLFLRVVVEDQRRDLRRRLGLE
jgi:MFS-type transporter involved in bile tolerance (Atg22 family)